MPCFFIHILDLQKYIYKEVKCLHWSKALNHTTLLLKLCIVLLLSLQHPADE